MQINSIDPGTPAWMLAGTSRAAKSDPHGQRASDFYNRPFALLQGEKVADRPDEGARCSSLTLSSMVGVGRRVTTRQCFAERFSSTNKPRSSCKNKRTAGMDFEELIETLSKGSATAVTTLESNVADLNALKAYLYVQTPVEAALRTEIDKNLKKPPVIFVCGSSGDGKSELFRRIYANYGTKVCFHLDATHSFDRMAGLCSIMYSDLWKTEWNSA